MTGASPRATLLAGVAAAARAEAESVRPFPEFLEELGRRLPDLEPIFHLLGEKERCARAEVALRVEAGVFRKLGWRLFRPLVAVSLLGAAGFVVQKSVDPVLGVTLFLAGAAALYAGAQILFWIRGRAALKRIGAVRAEYRARLQPLLGESATRG